jgi:hypothetical protein
MSFKAEMYLEDNMYQINALSVDISQEVDELGRPSSASRGGIIKLEIDSVKDDMLTDWVMNATKTLSGRITLYKADDSYTKLKDISFENAYCTELREKFLGAAFADRMLMLLTISSEKVSIGSIEVNNQWP